MIFNFVDDPNNADKIKENAVIKKNNIFNKFKSFINSFKFNNFKNKKIFLLVFIIVIILIAYYFLNFDSSSISSSSNIEVSETYINSLDYASILENKLENVLLELSGVGNVNVMITLASSLEVIYAETLDEKNNTTVSNNSSTSSTTTSSDAILIKNNGEYSPLIVKEILPTIKGVVVVCDGAKDVSIKLKIIQAIKALLDVPSSNIQVFS